MTGCACAGAATRRCLSSLSLFSFSGHLRSWACLSHTPVAGADSAIRLLCKMSDWAEIVVVVCDDYWVEWFDVWEVILSSRISGG